MSFTTSPLKPGRFIEVLSHQQPHYRQFPTPEGGTVVSPPGLRSEMSVTSHGGACINFSKPTIVSPVSPLSTANSSSHTTSVSQKFPVTPHTSYYQHVRRRKQNGNPNDSLDVAQGLPIDLALVVAQTSEQTCTITTRSKRAISLRPACR